MNCECDPLRLDCNDDCGRLSGTPRRRKGKASPGTLSDLFVCAAALLLILVAINWPK